MFHLFNQIELLPPVTERNPHQQRNIPWTALAPKSKPTAVNARLWHTSSWGVDPSGNEDAKIQSHPHPRHARTWGGSPPLFILMSFAISFPISFLFLSFSFTCNFIILSFPFSFLSLSFPFPVHVLSCSFRSHFLSVSFPVSFPSLSLYLPPSLSHGIVMDSLRIASHGIVMDCENRQSTRHIATEIAALSICVLRMTEALTRHIWQQLRLSLSLSLSQSLSLSLYIYIYIYIASGL